MSTRAGSQLKLMEIWYSAVGYFENCGSTDTL